MNWIKHHPNTIKKVVFVFWTDPNAKKYGQLLTQEFTVAFSQDQAVLK